MRTRAVASDSGGAYGSRFRGAMRGMRRVTPNGPVPAFSAVFAGAQQLSSAFTFTRASSATMFDSQGRLVWAPNNINIWSTDFSQAFWAKTNMSPTYGQTDVFGGTTAALMIPTATALANSCGLSLTPPAAAPYTSSFYVKTAGRRYCQLVFSGSWDSVSYATFDLQDGVVTGSAGAGASIVSAGNGWWRISLSTSSLPAVSGIQYFYAVDSAGATRAAVSNGDSVNGYVICAPQLERAGPDSPKSYVATTGSAYYGPRFDYNPATLSALGLLIEEARTNLVPTSSSGSGWTLSNFTTPGNGETLFGWASSRFATISSAGASANINCGAMVGTPTALASYTLSAIVKLPTGSTAQFIQLIGSTGWAGADAYANFDLVNGTVGSLGANATDRTITALGNGAYRITMTCPANAAPGAGTAAVILGISNGNSAGRLPVIPLATTMTFDVLLPQMELGAFATSVIPTFGAAATRAGDACDLAGTAPYSAAGTTYAADFQRYTIPPSGTNSALFYFGDAATAVVGFFGPSTPAQQRCDLINATVNEAQVSVALGTAGTIYKWATRLAPNDAKMAQNGVLGSADLVVNMPSSIPTTRQAIGRSNSAGAQQMHGWIRRFSIYTSGLTDAQLQALTA